MEKTKTLIAITLVLLLIVVALMVNVPFIGATIVNVETRAFLSINPNPTGVNQSVDVTVWLNPIPPTVSYVFHDFRITIIKPDESIDIIGPFTSSLVGSKYFTFTPEMVGKYYFQFTYPGELLVNGTRYYMPATSPITEVIVLQQPIPDYPVTPPPTDYWTHPISGMNREWYQISGNWLMRGYNATYRVFDSVAAFNPYTTAPRSAHVVWTKELTLGGLVGGEFGSQSYFAGLSYETKLNPPVILNGRLYYNIYPLTLGLPGFVCVDLRSGQELWRNNNYTLTCAQLYTYINGNQTGVVPYLWSIDTTYSMFDAFTGDLMLSFANASMGTIVYSEKGDMLVYILDERGKWLAMWNSTKAFQDNGRIGVSPNYMPVWNLRPGTLDWSKGIQWNVTIPQWNITVQDLMLTQKIQTIADDVIVTFLGNTSDWRFHAGYSAETGEQLWVFDRTKGYRDFPPFMSSGEGIYVQFDQAHMQYVAYDLHNGNLLWESDPLDYPWGMYSLFSTIAYDKLFELNHNGYIDAFDINTGKLMWKFYSGNSGRETRFGAYAFFFGPIVADEVVFAGTSDHSPNQPLNRGQRLFAIDVNTGKGIWNITGIMAVQAIADGYLLGYNAYDNQLYCFGKGKTATTVTGPESVQPLGTPVLIKGTVTDQSPSAKDTPAIADEYMTEWMEYLYMQKPIPGDIKGVTVKLSAIDSNGNYISIGRVTSDMNGMFKKMWTPEYEDEYIIIATFEGSESYWSSYAETAIGVTEVSSPAGPITIAAVAVIIVICIVSIYMLRKQRK